jgi:hypothetical protein
MLGNPIAIVDIGSNSVRLVVYAGSARVPSAIFNEKVMAGLGREMPALCWRSGAGSERWRRSGVPHLIDQMNVAAFASCDRSRPRGEEAVRLHKRVSRKAASIGDTLGRIRKP